MSYQYRRHNMTVPLKRFIDNGYIPQNYHILLKFIWKHEDYIVDKMKYYEICPNYSESSHGEPFFIMTLMKNVDNVVYFFNTCGHKLNSKNRDRVILHLIDLGYYK